MKDIELPSVRDRDLRAILAHFGLDGNLESGTLRCHSCSRPLTWDNIGALRVIGSTLAMYCDFSECLTTASQGQE